MQLLKFVAADSEQLWVLVPVQDSGRIYFSNLRLNTATFAWKLLLSLFLLSLAVFNAFSVSAAEEFFPSVLELLLVI